MTGLLIMSSALAGGLVGFVAGIVARSWSVQSRLEALKREYPTLAVGNLNATDFLP